MLEEVEAMENRSRQRPKVALSLFETHVPQLVKTVREYARDLLLREMVEISRKHFGTLWAPDLEFQIWRAIEDGPVSLDEREVDRLEELAEIAGGWFQYLGQPEEIGQGAEPDFIVLEEWERTYAEYRKETIRQSPANMQARIEELEAKLQRKEKD